MSIIYCVGLMGSGKTTLARKLSNSLGFQCIDTDAVIVTQTSSNISDFVVHNGETSFRDIESEVIMNPLVRSNVVISTGGGSILRSANRDFMKETGKVIYLQTCPSIISKRIKSTDNRFLLDGIDDIEKTLITLANQREPLYQEVADVVIDTSFKTEEQVHDEAATYFGD